MEARQPAWMRGRDVSEQRTAVLDPPQQRTSRTLRTQYGRPPAWFVAVLTIAVAIVAFVLLLAGQTIVAAALALVAFVLAIAFAPEIREVLRFTGFAGWAWGRTGARIGQLRVERKRTERRLDKALHDLGSATFAGDGERMRRAQERANEASASLASACDEETRLVGETRAGVARRRQQLPA
jgi:hypothetical protein